MGKKYSDYAEELAKELIEMVERGQAPWQKGYSVAGFEAESYTTGRTYSSGNGLKLLMTSIKNNFEDNRWITEKQAGLLGGTPKGKGAEILYFTDEKEIKVKNAETGAFEKKKVRLGSPIMKTSVVYNVEQCDGIELKELATPKSLGWKDADLLNEIRDKTQASVTHSSTVEGGSPFYSVNEDKIGMPPPEAYDDPRRYASSLIHETAHWTGNEKRLNRDFGIRGTKKYAREELVAEISTMLIGGRTGIDTFVENNEAYIAGWWKAIKEQLEEKPTEVMRICKDAYAVCDYVLEGKELDRLAKSSVSHAVELNDAEKESGRVDFDIPFSEKDSAKSLARSLDVDLKWDKAGKTWFGNVQDGQNIGSLAAFLVRNDPQEPELEKTEKEAGNMTRINLEINYMQKDAAKYHAAELGLSLKFDRVEKTWFTEIPEGEELKLDQLKELINPATRTEALKSDSGEKIQAHVKIDYDDRLEFQAQAKAANVATSWDKEKKAWLIVSPVENKESFDKLIEAVESRNESKKIIAFPAQKAHEEKEGQEALKIYLTIPFESKDSIIAQAKEAGMPLKWDAELKSWHTYEGELKDSFKQYLPDPNQKASVGNIQSAADALVNIGAEFTGNDLIYDGKFHRVKAVGDKPGQKSVTYQAWNNGIPNATMINHKTGVKTKWIGKHLNLSTEEKARLSFVSQQNIEAKKSELAKSYKETADRAKLVYDEAKPLSNENSYVIRKAMETHSLKENDKGEILVSAQNIDGEIKTLQKIKKDGSKQFMPGGEVSGHFHVIGKLQDGAPIIITEGIATGSTIHQITGKASIVAFHASNLKKVTALIDERYPNSPIVIAADNDHQLAKTSKLKENVGVVKANEAALATGALVAIPPFDTNEPKDAKNSDFNDLLLSRGAAIARKVIIPVIEQATGLKLLTPVLDALFDDKEKGKEKEKGKAKSKRASNER